MHNNDNTEAGYVYILTNPSFREDWVKIGNSKRPPDVRSHQLDNTSVLLPFEVYAMMKTTQFKEVEKSLHKLLGDVADKRIRRNREFFNVTPEKALESFRELAKFIPDAEISYGSEKQPVVVPQEQARKGTDKRKTLHKKNDTLLEKEIPYRARFSWDGKNYYYMAEFVPLFVRKYAEEDNPDKTFAQLKTEFKTEWLGKHKRCGFLATLQDIKDADIAEASKQKSYHYNDESLKITSSDGVCFWVNNQWMRDTFKSILRFACEKGYEITMK